MALTKVSGDVIDTQTPISIGSVNVGSATSTGTASQTLQVTGGAYVSGSVGIGITNPGNPLEIFGSGPHLRIASNATSGYGYIQLGKSATASQNWHFGSEGNNQFNFWNGNWGSGVGPLLSLYSAGSTTTHAVTINTTSLTGTASQPLQVTGGAYVSGSVGIGITNPGCSLQINGGVRARGGAPGASGVNNNGYAFSGGSGDNDSGMFSSADGQLEFYSNSNEALRITSGRALYVTQTPGSYTIDTTAGATSIANNGTVDFSNASGMLVVNNHSSGAVTIYLCGGGNASVVSNLGTQVGTLTYVVGIAGYRWTNNSGSTSTFGFFFVRTRTTA